MKWSDVKETNKVKLIFKNGKGEASLHGEVYYITEAYISICGYLNKDLSTLTVYTLDRRNVKTIDRTRLVAETSKRVSELAKKRKGLEKVNKEKEKKEAFTPKIVPFNDLTSLLLKKFESESMGLPYFDNGKIFFRLGYGSIDPNDKFVIKQEYDGYTYLKPYKEADVTKAITKFLNKQLVDDYYFRALTSFGKVKVMYDATIESDFHDVEGAGIDINLTYSLTLKEIQEAELHILYTTLKSTFEKIKNDYRLYTL